ncbi:hypothetical protein ACIRRA_05280 [Nocardia sp. NPDC101769]|uniref:hypothetical protein n=1 Tax=Nocardia sp. NPDC101769 TaxID=3364333 RepID=UPI0037FAF141
MPGNSKLLEEATPEAIARSSPAALGPDEYPVPATHLDVNSELLTSDAVFHDGLRRLIAARAAGAS